MTALAAHIATGLRLNVRNPMALTYGYIFPTIFLVAFLVVYRHDPAPLIQHLGELLTVTALGGACFGMPTTMVNDRERGVWRRYRLTPLPAASFLGGIVATRFVLLLSAAILQLAIGAALGMPFPAHPVALAVAFLATAFAFVGLGLLVAALAGSVASVQALGQCIFLPMLMIGGVAVRLESLPEWAITLSAFFPGRYAVEALQAAATGGAITKAWPAIGVLLAMGMAAGIAALGLFRWQAGQRLRDVVRPSWLAAALVIWAAASLVSLDRTKAAPRSGAAVSASTPPAPFAPSESPRERKSVANAPAVAPDANPRGAAQPPSLAPAVAGWRGVTSEQIGNLPFNQLPPDEGLVTPIAKGDAPPDSLIAAKLAEIRAALPTWPSARVDDPVQRTRNLLYVAAVADVLQMDPLERHLPLLVFDELARDHSREDLQRLLYWVATRPQEGDVRAIDDLPGVGLPSIRGPTTVIRERAAIYAVKLIRRLKSQR